MNSGLMRKLFPEETKQLEEKRCPFCCKNMISAKFKDELSKKEFEISGLCQNCQDDMFG